MCLPIISGIVSGIGAAMAAKNQQASLDAQAAFKKRQAGMEIMSGGYKASRTQDAVNRTTGSQRAGFAANGLALTGSAADVIIDTETEGQLDIAAIRWNSNLASDNLKYQAKIDRMNAKAAGKSAPFAFAAPVINGIASYASEFA